MVKVDESNASVCCCQIIEYVANASEPGGRETKHQWEKADTGLVR
jgi:hypothetical protein